VRGVRAAAQPRPPIRFAGPAKNSSSRSPSFDRERITTEGALTARDLDDALTTGDPGALVALLDQHLFIAAYVRTFTVQKGAAAPRTWSASSCCSPTRRPAGDRLRSRGRDAHIRVSSDLGAPDLRRQLAAVAVNGVVKDPSGGQISVTSVRILYALANVAVQISIEDEPQKVDPLDAVELANRELQYLRLSAPLAPPK